MEIAALLYNGRINETIEFLSNVVKEPWEDSISGFLVFLKYPLKGDAEKMKQVLSDDLIKIIAGRLSIFLAYGIRIIHILMTRINLLSGLKMQLIVVLSIIQCLMSMTPFLKTSGVKKGSGSLWNG